MEHIEHGDLSRHIHDLEEWDAKVIGRQLLEALDVLRSENIAHHDLKPGNVFVVRKKPQWVRCSCQNCLEFRGMQRLTGSSGLRLAISASVRT